MISWEELKDKEVGYSLSGDSMGWLCFEYDLWASSKHPNNAFKPTAEHYQAKIQETKDMLEAVKSDRSFH